MGQFAKTVLAVGSVVAAPFTAGTSLAWLPAALGAGAAVTGLFDTASGQQQQQGAYNAAEGNYGNLLNTIATGIVPEQLKVAGSQEDLANKEQGLLPQFQDISKQLQDPAGDVQPLLDAQRGGIKTLQSTIGGVANPGALIKELFGSAITNALDASARNRTNRLTSSSNVLSQGLGALTASGNALSGAASTLGGATSGLGTAATGYGNQAASAAGAAGKSGGAYGPLFDALNNAVAGLKKTLPGTTKAGGDVPVPSGGGGIGNTSDPFNPITGGGGDVPPPPG